MTELKMLNLSTCHIPYAETKVAKQVAMYTDDYGWIFWTGLATEEFSNEAPVLASIIMWARKRKYDYVQLDSDGDVTDEFPTFT